MLRTITIHRKLRFARPYEVLHMLEHEGSPSSVKGHHLLRAMPAGSSTLTPCEGQLLLQAKLHRKSPHEFREHRPLPRNNQRHERPRGPQGGDEPRPRWRPHQVLHLELHEPLVERGEAENRRHGRIPQPAGRQ